MSMKVDRPTEGQVQRNVAPLTCTAWRRPAPGQPWQRLFDAAGLDAAWAKLVAMRLVKGVTVLPLNRDPNKPRRFPVGRK